MGLPASALQALKEFILARRAAAATAPEQKMLQGVYRGYAGDEALPEQVFTANQKHLADYFAQRRAAQTGQTPHAEMILIDPNTGVQYGLHPPALPEHGIPQPEYSRVRKVKPEDVVERTQLYARGGPVRKQVGGPFIGHVAPESNLGHDQVAPGMRKGGLSQIKECSCGR